VEKLHIDLIIGETFVKVNKKAYLISSALIIGSSLLAIPGIAAAETSAADLSQQIKIMQGELKAVQDQLTVQQQKTAANEATIQKIQIPKQIDSYKPGTVNMYTGAANPNAADSQNFLQRERDDSLSFGMPSGGGITMYGNFDLSVDGATNGINGHTVPPNSNGTAGATAGPGAYNGWLTAIATNSTYVGLRGFQPVSDWHDTQFLWQLQTNIAISTVGGSGMSNSQQSNAVSGSLTTATSYIGFGSKDYGSVKIGKAFSPYALSTNIFNPFSGQLGSMNVVMGNTGGDNRVEFGTLMQHAIWYESPKFGHTSFAAMFSPGQNRATDSAAIPAGSSDCNGGNIPGSGGLIGGPGSNIGPGVGSPDGCNDGGFSNAFSASLVYDDKTAWYLTAGYEEHQKVNRGSDFFGTANPLGDPANPTAQLANYYLDTGKETAAKVGAVYRFQSTGTWIGGLYETFHRAIDPSIQSMNERERKGTWIFITQNLPHANQVNLGWAHAGNTPGDAAGQHNYDPTINYSTADMYTINGTHQVDRNLSFYADYAVTVNHGNDHYDLGAGGHGVTTDCHASSYNVPASGGVDSAPQCWAGTRLAGLSVGMKYRF
jgi:predicted porin